MDTRIEKIETGLFKIQNDCKKIAAALDVVDRELFDTLADNDIVRNNRPLAEVAMDYISVIMNDINKIEAELSEFITAQNDR